MVWLLPATPRADQSSEDIAIMLKALLIITVLLVLCLLLVIFWSACSLSGQISRLEEAHWYKN